MKSAALIVSGLPASGKTTIAKRLAARLEWPFLDKDDFLEDLFNDRPVHGPDDRRRLSQFSDTLFREQASKLDRIVLVSHWRPRHGTGDTGTPIDWLSGTFDVIVEIHCVCDAEIAAARFVRRDRHPSHLDHTRSPEEISRWMQALSGGYPLKIGTGLSINTEGPCKLDELLRRMTAMGLKSQDG